MVDFVALLLVATLFGGMMLYSFGFAPMVFSALPGAEAGRFIRAAFPWYYLFIIATAALGGLVLLARDRVGGGLVLGVALVAVYARQGLMPMINRARDAGETARFGRLHGLSVALNFVQIFAAGWALFRFL